ncbi:MAG: hypothetical protein PHF58_10535 [Methylotenera sp.]|nr:hypothetical protein [Methylotenera sp.]
MDEVIKRNRRNKLLLLLDEFPREKEFASIIGVEPSYLSRIKGNQAIGGDIARRIERAMNKPSLWMDDPIGAMEESGVYQLEIIDKLSEEERVLIENFRILCHGQQAAMTTVISALAQLAENKKSK